MPEILKSRPISAGLQLLIVRNLWEWLQPSAKQQVDFPGVLALDRGSVVLAVGFSVDAAGHCTATLPICALPIQPDQVALARLAYGELSVYAANNGFRSLRCLMDEETDPQTQKLLSDCAWKTTARILRWRCTVVDASEQLPRWLSEAALHFGIHEVDVHEAQIQEFLKGTLECSDDLPEEMRPSPHELVLNWDALQHGYRAIGFFDASDSNQLAGLLVSSVSQECYETNIEYIGVAPGLRQRGIGRKLIRSVLSRLPEGGSVTAFADAANSPANRLYTSAGFQVDRHWILLNREMT